MHSTSSDDDSEPHSAAHNKGLPPSIHNIKELKTEQHKQMGNAQFRKYLKAHPGLDSVLYDLERLWASEQAPDFYTEGFIATLKLHDLEVILEQATKQLALAKQFKNPYHRILESIRSRQLCLEKIRTQIGTIQRSNVLRLFKKKYTRDTEADRLARDANLEGYGSLEVKVSPDDALLMIKNLLIDMCRLRQLTVYTVEVIHKWREKVELSLSACMQSAAPVYFLLEGSNFYQRMRTDSNFIWNSVLSDYIYFAWDCDIFLVRNVLTIEGLPDKELLEQYFLDIVYPKEDNIFDRAVQAMEYMAWKTPPPKEQDHAIQELLVKNYLAMDYSPARRAKQRQDQDEQQKRLLFRENAREELTKKPHKIHKLQLQKKLHQKLARIKNIEEQISGNNLKVKPFNIVNFGVKKSLDLQYQARKEEIDLVPKEPLRPQQQQTHLIPQTEAQNTVLISTKRGSESPKDKSHNSKQPGKTPLKLRVNSLIRMLEKSSNHKQLLTRKDLYKFDQHSRSLEHLKLQRSLEKHKQSKQGLDTNPLLAVKAQINTLLSGEGPPTHALTSPNKHQTKLMLQTLPAVRDQIEVEEGFEPINRRMFDIFGTLPRKSHKKLSQAAQTQRDPNATPFKRNSEPKLRKLSDFIKNQNEKGNFKIHRKKELKLQLAEKPENLYEDYSRVKQGSHQLQDEATQISQVAASDEPYLWLQPKTIPLDIIDLYLEHLFSITNPVLSLFTDYSKETIANKLRECPRAFIFQILNRSDENVGTAVVTEYVSKIGFVKYTVEFIHVDKFQYFVKSILLISEEVFHKTCAEELVVPMKIDKMDEVSVEFAKIINNQFKAKAILLEKSMASYLGHDIYSRLYIIRRELDTKLQILKQNYDTRVEVKASGFVFSSNFKLRKMSYLTRHFHKTTRQIKLNISLLYSRLLEKIVTKHHLKLLKQAPPNIKELLVQLHKAVSIESYDKILVRQFNSTEDLRGYLEYRQYDSQQRLLQFLQDSKFIMKKQLVLAQFQISTKLDFATWQTVCSVNGENIAYIILQNYRKFEIETILSNDFSSQMTFVPCLEDGYSMILMPAGEYMQLDTDLYTYLSSFLQTEFKRRKQVPDTICIPEAVFRHKITQSDTLEEQFPERQFYYSGHIQIGTTHNMQLGIIRQPKGLVFELPLIIGFFNKGLEVCYLLEQRHYRKLDKS